MAKPILIVEVPINYTDEELSVLSRQLVDELHDYHILTITTDRDDFDFKVFYEKDFTDINLDELKKLVKQR
tara:strand:+ start:201 stop:413 length:213 start_codon:yes stop_codon:yes gene_type:complete